MKDLEGESAKGLSELLRLSRDAKTKGLIHEADHFINEGELIKAQNNIENILRLAPTNTHAYLLLTKLVETFLNLGQAEEAERLCIDALQLVNRESLELQASKIWRQLAAALVILKKYDQAGDAFIKMLLIRQARENHVALNESEINFIIGVSDLLGEEESEKAILFVQEVIKIDKNCAPLCKYVGNLFIEQQKPHKALSYLKHAKGLGENSRDINLAIGRALLHFEPRRREIIEEAIASFIYAESLGENSADLYYYLGKCCFEILKPKEAIEAFDKALAAIDNDDFDELAELHTQRARALAKLGKIEEALISYNKAIELEEDFYPNYTERGQILILLNQCEAAIVDFQKAFEMCPVAQVDEMMYEGLGFALLMLNRPKEALKVFEDSMELTECSVRLRLGQSAALWQLKQYVPATEILRLIQPSRTTQPGEVEWKILGGPALKPVLFSYPRGVVNPLHLLEIEDDDIESDFPSSISPDTLVQRPESSQGDLNSAASSSAPNTEGDAMDIENTSSSAIDPEELMQSSNSSERNLNTPTSSPLASMEDASLSEEELDSANASSSISRLKRSTSTSFDDNNKNKRNKI